MSSNEVPIYKENSIMRASVSPAASAGSFSCSSTGALSFGGSQSSECISLTFTDADITDVDLQELNAPSDDEAEELCGSCTSSLRPDGASLERHLVAPELCRLIREDLERQHNARTKPVKATAMPHGNGTRAVISTSASIAASGAYAAPAGALLPRRLPAQHRALIVGWMRQVTSALRLHLSTLFAATALLDRFVAAAEALPADGLLQLLALTCMSVAVKYNEVGQVAPSVWLSLAVDPAGRRLYTACDLQRYEFTVLQAVSWQLTDPTAFTFLEHFLMCLNPYDGGIAPPQAAAAAAAVPAALTESPLGSRAIMLAELSLMYDTFQSYDASAVALACVSLAERMTMATPTATCTAGALSTVATPPPPALPPPSVTVLVAATTGLRLELVAPGLGPCVDALEACCAVSVC